MTSHRQPPRADGMVLYATLILLIIMSLLGLTASRSAQMQMKMARNIFELNQARQAAESALRDAEQWLANQTTPPEADSSCTTPCAEDIAVWAEGSAGSPLSFDWRRNGREFGYDYVADTDTRDLPEVVGQPRYRIEEAGREPDSLTLGLGASPAKYYYGIAAQGHGVTRQSEVVVESLYARRFN